MSLWRSIREYLLAVLGAYQSFVIGLVFGVAGAIGLFTSGQGGIRVLALIGVALGFLVAPFQAFHRMRRQRDEARSNDQFRRFRGYSYANALSFTSWLIDNSPWPLNEPAMIVHTIAASSSAACHDVELDSAFADRVCQLAAQSTLDRWMRQLLGETEESAASWRLVISDGYQVVVERERVTHVGGGSALWARYMLALPRGMGIATPRLVVDFIASDLPESGTAPPQIDRFTNLTLAGTPYQPDLEELFQLLDAIADTIALDLSPALLPQLTVHRLRDRIRTKLRGPETRLVGPNFEITSRPRPLDQVIAPPSFPRLPGNLGDTTILVETPAHFSAIDRYARHELFRRGIGRFLRSHQYRHFEAYVDQLGTV